MPLDWNGNTTRTASGLDTWMIGNAAFASQAPTIDGVISVGEWDEAAAFPLENLVHSSMSAEGFEASFRAKWDNTFLYLLVEATDAMGLASAGNRVEIYISTAYTRRFGQWQNPGYAPGDYQILIPMSPTAAGHELGFYSDKTPLASFTRGQTITADSYVLEIRIAWSDLGGLPAFRGLPNTDYIGFEIQIQRGTQNNNRAKLSWAGDVDVAWASTEDWGTLRLLPAGGDTGTRTWAGFPVTENGWADTGNFFGWMYVNFGAFVYSYLLDGFLFMPETLVDENGAWTYSFR